MYEKVKKRSTKKIKLNIPPASSKDMVIFGNKLISSARYLTMWSSFILSLMVSTAGAFKLSSRRNSADESDESLLPSSSFWFVSFFVVRT